MSAGLLSQLEAYGDVFASAVDARALEEAMRTDETIVPFDPTIEAPKRSRTPWRRAAATLGVAAVFVAVILGVTALRDGDTVANPPFTTPGAAVETLTFAENTGDWELYRASLDDEATVDGLIDLPDGEARLEAVFFYNYGIGRVTEVQECSATLAIGGIGCIVDYYDGIGEALGLDAIDVPRTFRLRDGLLEYAGGPEFAPDEQPQLAAEFVEYLSETGLGDESDAYFLDPTQWGRESAYQLGQRVIEAAEEFMASR